MFWNQWQLFNSKVFKQGVLTHFVKTDKINHRFKLQNKDTSVYGLANSCYWSKWAAKHHAQCCLNRFIIPISTLKEPTRSRIKLTRNENQQAIIWTLTSFDRHFSSRTHQIRIMNFTMNQSEPIWFKAIYHFHKNIELYPKEF